GQGGLHPLRVGIPQLRHAGRLPRSGSRSEKAAPKVAVFSEEDREYMLQALALAEFGMYTATPNPRVGCVIVRDGAVVGEGWHRKAGEPHGEAIALEAAGDKARGAAVYVSLEPCSHFGRTPPCADALIRADVSRGRGNARPGSQ